MARDLISSVTFLHEIAAYPPPFMRPRCVSHPSCSGAGIARATKLPSKLRRAKWPWPSSTSTRMVRTR